MAPTIAAARGEREAYRDRPVGPPTDQHDLEEIDGEVNDGGRSDGDRDGKEEREGRHQERAEPEAREEREGRDEERYPRDEGVPYGARRLRAARSSLAAPSGLSRAPGSARPVAGGSGAHREHRPWRVAHDLLGDAPDQEVGEPGASLGGHDDARRAARRIDDASGRVTDDDA